MSTSNQDYDNLAYCIQPTRTPYARVLIRT